ncbi:RTA1 like protein-domain-containing protein [Mycena galericulata]|nr:RTA1 like protein-domain-containing protein [Mycena galericulata]
MVPHPRPLSFSAHHPAPRLSHSIPAAAAKHDDKHDDGGLASSNANNLAGANVGANVMLGGIAFQFAVILIFSTLAIDFVRRYVWDRATCTDWAPRGVLTPRLRIMLAAVAFSTTTLFIRSVYRIIELASGWEGRIIHTERYFDVLDGGMVVLAIFTVNIAHPGLLLEPKLPTKAEALELESGELA